MTTPPDLERGQGPLGPLAPRVATASWTRGCSSQPLPLTSNMGQLVWVATRLGKPFRKNQIA